MGNGLINVDSKGLFQLPVLKFLAKIIVPIIILLVLLVFGVALYAIRNGILLTIGPFELGPATTIISGTISSNGNSSGELFTSSRKKEGEYIIEYKGQVFKTAPVVVATPVSGAESSRSIGDTIINVCSNPKGCMVWTYEVIKKGKASPKDEEFNFIAVGKLEHVKRGD